MFPLYTVANISIERAKLIQSQLEALGAVVEIRSADFAELVNEKVPTEKNKERTLLMKHMQDYTARTMSFLTTKPWNKSRSFLSNSIIVYLVFCLNIVGMENSYLT